VTVDGMVLCTDLEIGTVEEVIIQLSMQSDMGGGGGVVFA
jgi:hypothetical protein